MATEIERKFLTSSDAWKREAIGMQVRQGYLPTDPSCAVRVRVIGPDAFLTLKGPTSGATRLEYEYRIPQADAEEILAKLCGSTLIEKTRYRIRHSDHVWEVDEFHGGNEGLVVAEIELSELSEPFAKPSWAGEEVTSDPRYLNVNLANHPYSTW